MSMMLHTWSVEPRLNKPSFGYHISLKLQFESFFLFWKLGICPKDRLIRGVQSHHPLVGTPFKAITKFCMEYGIIQWNWHQGESNLRPWEEHTPRTQANTTRPSQVGLQFESSHVEGFTGADLYTMKHL
jgi:hypothetical protein